MKKSISVKNALDLALEEKSVLHGIITGGKDAFVDVMEIVRESSFDSFDNKIIFDVLRRLFNNGQDFSIINILSECKSVGVDNERILDEVLAAPAAAKNDLVSISGLLKNKEIIKTSIDLHRKSLDELHQLSATDSPDKIFSVSENALFNLVKSFSNVNDEIIDLSLVVEGLVNYWESNPTINVGIPTPWPKFNESIGGGMRTGVTLIGSRSGVGKTSIAIMIANFLCENLGIPVLILDTEMEHKDILPRMLANISDIEIRKIESGQFGLSDYEKTAVYTAVEKMKKFPLSYKSVAGKGFDEIMSIVRRWIYTKVGIKSDGRANQCLVIYDYFKIMDSAEINDMSEFQAMGFQISKLTDFCKAYDLPCLSFVQLNRDGVAKEGTDVIAQSDRLLWLANSFSLFKPKTIDEIQHDGPNNGNRKMITLKSRYGGESQHGEYISMQWKGSTCSLIEISIRNNDNVEETQIEQW